MGPHQCPSDLRRLRVEVRSAREGLWFCGPSPPGCRLCPNLQDVTANVAQSDRSGATGRRAQAPDPADRGLVEPPSHQIPETTTQTSHLKGFNRRIGKQRMIRLRTSTKPNDVRHVVEQNERVATQARSMLRGRAAIQQDDPEPKCGVTKPVRAIASATCSLEHRERARLARCRVTGAEAAFTRGGQRWQRGHGGRRSVLRRQRERTNTMKTDRPRQHGTHRRVSESEAKPRLCLPSPVAPFGRLIVPNRGTHTQIGNGVLFFFVPLCNGTPGALVHVCVRCLGASRRHAIWSLKIPRRDATRLRASHATN